MTAIPVNCQFIGIQEAPEPMEPMPLYTLRETIPGHVVGSTVTERSIVAAGYTVPADEKRKAEAAGMRGTHTI